MNLPLHPGEPFSYSTAHELGLSTRALARAVREGRLTRLRHGWYCLPTGAEEPRGAARLRTLRAALSSTSPDAVASHSSAALLHGLPLVGSADSDTVHVTRPRSSGGRTSTGMVQHTSPGPVGVVEIDGMPVTTVLRTVVDVARTCGFIAGVCVADAALHNGKATTADLQDEVERHRGRAGAGTARAVAAFADGLAESPGESFSRCLIAQWPEIPSPRLQHKFYSPRGEFVAKTDFDWDGKLVGEFDGVTKYSGGLLKGEDPGKVVWSEKRREDAIRDLGSVVVRWAWADLHAPVRLRRLLRTGLTRAGML